MAHSTRKKDKQKRGGMTKNQLRKSNASKHGSITSQSDRLRSTEAWMKEIQERKDKPEEKKVTVPKKRKKPNMSRPTQERRARITKMLESQLKENIKISRAIHFNVQLPIPLTEGDRKRIKHELETLKHRIDGKAA